MGKKYKLLSSKILAVCVVWLLRFWGKTLRLKIANSASFHDPVVRSRRPVYLLWHDEFFPLIAAHPAQGLICVVSQSGDGELLSRVLARFGFALARGSSSRGGLQALKTAIQFVDDGGSGVVLTADGPRGPRHRIKSGAVFLASYLQSPLILVRVRMQCRFVFTRSWDQFQLPYPFSRCQFVYSKPLEIPHNISRQALSELCVELEKQMQVLLEE